MVPCKSTMMWIQYSTGASLPFVVIRLDANQQKKPISHHDQSALHK